MTAAMYILRLPALLLGVRAFASAHVQQSNATGRVAKVHDIAAIQRSSSSKPQEDLKFLSKKDLKPITSIHCLKMKQLHPNRHCDDEDGEKSFRGEINMGHFPNWQDQACHSNKEFFCDPHNLLTGKQQDTVHDRLQTFKERTMVNCGAFQESQDPHSDHWYDKHSPIYEGRLGIDDHRPFNLAVVVADEWPENEMDPTSIEYFGRVIMSQWGLMPNYNGVDNGKSVNQVYTWGEYYSNCPNAAVLFILPKYHEAFISSPSCEWLCQSRGGPEVVAAALAGLDRGGPEEAIKAGIDRVESVLKVTLAVSAEKAPVSAHWRGRPSHEMVESDEAWVSIIRAVYVFVIAFAVICIVAFVYYVFFPEKTRQYRSAFSVAAATRRDMQEAMTQG